MICWPAMTAGLFPRACTASSPRAGRWSCFCCGRQAVQTGGSGAEAGRELAEARANSEPASSLDVWECLVGGKGLRPGVQVQVTADGRGQSQEQITATILAETDRRAPGRLSSPGSRLAVGRR